jgi:hypothetical protein
LRARLAAERVRAFARARASPLKSAPRLRERVVLAHVCREDRVDQQPPRRAPVVGRQALEQVGAARAQHRKREGAVVVLLDCAGGSPEWLREEGWGAVVVSV